MQLRSCFFFHFESASTVTFTLLIYNNDTFLLVVIKTRNNLFIYFSKKSSLHSTACVFNNRCVSSVLFQLFFLHHSWRNPKQVTKTHACWVWLTLISSGCGVLRLTRVLDTKLKRPGTRSNRLGPDPDPADHLKYRPEPVRVPGRVPGPRVSGPPWRPLILSTTNKSVVLSAQYSVLFSYFIFLSCFPV